MTDDTTNDAFRAVCDLVSLRSRPDAPLSSARTCRCSALDNWMWYNENGWKDIEKGRYDRAEQKFRMAIKEIEPYSPANRKLMARTYCDLARVLYYQERYADAEPLAKWALSVRDADKKASRTRFFSACSLWRRSRLAQEHYADAEPHFKRALAIQEKELTGSHVNILLTLDRLAFVLRSQGKYHEAEPLYLPRHRHPRAKDAGREPRPRRHDRSVRDLVAQDEPQGRRREMAGPRAHDSRHGRDQGGQGEDRPGSRKTEGIQVVRRPVRTPWSSDDDRSRARCARARASEPGSCSRSVASILIAIVWSALGGPGLDRSPLPEPPPIPDPNGYDDVLEAGRAIEKSGLTGPKLDLAKADQTVLEPVVRGQPRSDRSRRGRASTSRSRCRWSMT